MNKMSEWYKNYVIFIGVFTLLAMGVLFINLLGWFKGTAITLGFSSVIGGLVWYSLVKIKPLPVIARMADPPEDYRLILTNSLSRLKTPWKKIVLLHAVILLFLNVNFFWMASEIFSRISLPFTLFYCLLAFMTTAIKVLPLWKAKKLIGQKERVLSLSQQGISLPIELLNEAAIFKATRKKQTEVFISWSDVLQYEVFAGARPQIRLTLKPAHEYADLKGRLAIFRTAQLDQILDVIESFKPKSV